MFLTILFWAVVVIFVGVQCTALMAWIEDGFTPYTFKGIKDEADNRMQLAGYFLLMLIPVGVTELLIRFKTTKIGQWLFSGDF